MRFLIDMPVTPNAVSHLRAAAHDAVHASAAGLTGATDAQIIDAARREQCIVVTADLDYPRLLALERADSPGVILFRGGSYSDTEMLALLDRVLAVVPEHVLQRSITVVDRHRIRRHTLPLTE